MKAALFGLCLAVSGCALFSKNEIAQRRYFSPDLPSERPKAVQRANAELRLGRITAGAAIGERIMFRASEYELGFYDDRIWTEKPEAYLRRALTRVLFEEQGLHSVVRGAGPTLDVELVGFEEVRAPLHVGRVTIAWTLSDERVVTLQQTVSIDRPIADDTAESTARAMGEALRDAVDEISGRVSTDLAGR